VTIRYKITLWYTAFLALTLAIFSVGIYMFVNYNTYNDAQRLIQDNMGKIEINIPLGLFGPLDLIPNAIEPESNNIYIQVVNYKQYKVDQSNNLEASGLILPFPKVDVINMNYGGYVNRYVDQYHFMIFEEPIVMNEQLLGLLQVAYFMNPIEKYMANLLTILLISSLVMLVLAFGFGIIVARQALRPVQNVISAVNRIENGSSLGVRIERVAAKNDEIGQLTDTLNSMLERIETTYNELDGMYRTQKRFVSDASHELRTPLTTIRGNVELLQRMSLGLSVDASDALRDVQEEAERMSTLVNDLLSLARVDAGNFKMALEVQPLLPIIEDVARQAGMLAHGGITWLVGDLAELAPVHVQGNRDYLRQLIFIFVDNAFKYTLAGHVKLSVVLEGTDLGLTEGTDVTDVAIERHVGIVIEDTGIGMSKDQVPHIFERFYRADASRGKQSGTGLGLAIAQWIIDEHQGSIEVHTRLGKGTTFTLWLPIAGMQVLEELEKEKS
jgi:signal transduction histidine kinase